MGFDRAWNGDGGPAAAGVVHVVARSTIARGRDRARIRKIVFHLLFQDTRSFARCRSFR
jgi:hypothetical protein